MRTPARERQNPTTPGTAPKPSWEKVLAKNRTVSNIRARYYDSAIGRWTSQDPLGFDAGDSNLFRYVSNRPLMEFDPSGLFRFTPFDNQASKQPKQVKEIKIRWTAKNVNARPGPLTNDLEINGEDNYVKLNLANLGIFHLNNPLTLIKYKIDVQVDTTSHFYHRKNKNENWALDEPYTGILRPLNVYRFFDKDYRQAANPVLELLKSVKKLRQTTYEATTKDARIGIDFSNARFGAWMMMKSTPRRPNPRNITLLPYKFTFYGGPGGEQNATRKIVVNVIPIKATITVWEMKVTGAKFKNCENRF